LTQGFQDIEAALAACSISGGGGPEIAHLRKLLEPFLVVRLTTVSANRDEIRASIDDAFELFRVAVGQSQSVNWFSWLTSASLSILAERTRHVVWLDWVAADALPGSPLERRMLVIGTILTFDSDCQWRLLRCISQRWMQRRLAWWCRHKLVERINDLARS
jgi:hypothetical protein